MGVTTKDIELAPAGRGAARGRLHEHVCYNHHGHTKVTRLHAYLSIDVAVRGQDGVYRIDFHTEAVASVYTNKDVSNHDASSCVSQQTKHGTHKHGTRGTVINQVRCAHTHARARAYTQGVYASTPVQVHLVYGAYFLCGNGHGDTAHKGIHVHAAGPSGSRCATTTPRCVAFPCVGYCTHDAALHSIDTIYSSHASDNTHALVSQRRSFPYGDTNGHTKSTHASLPHAPS